MNRVDDVVRARIVVVHEPANKLTGLDPQSAGPEQVAAGRNTASSVLELRNERVIPGSHYFSQTALRQSTALAQLAQPLSRLLAQLVASLGRLCLGVEGHRNFPDRAVLERYFWLMPGDLLATGALRAFRLLRSRGI